MTQLDSRIARLAPFCQYSPVVAEYLRTAAAQVAKGALDEALRWVERAELANGLCLCAQCFKEIPGGCHNARSLSPLGVCEDCAQ